MNRKGNLERKNLVSDLKEVNNRQCYEQLRKHLLSELQEVKGVKITIEKKHLTSAPGSKTVRNFHLGQLGGTNYGRC